MFLNRKPDLGLLILRVGIGITFMMHGWPKLAGGAEKWTMIGQAMGHLGINFYPAFWGLMASVSEFFGGIFLLLGLGTRVSTLFLAFTMFVATLVHVKGGDPFSKSSHAIELLVVFLSIFFLGSGKFSIDHFFRGKK